MAAIVAMLPCFPLGLALALLLRIIGTAFESLITFGGALVYAARVFPWGDRVPSWKD